jgi:hypothetical protein
MDSFLKIIINFLLMKIKFFNEIHLMYECMYLKCMDVQMMYTFYEDQDHFVKTKIYLVKKSWIYLFPFQALQKIC